MDQLCPLLSFYFCLPYTDHNVLILFSLHFSCSRRVKKKKVQARNFLAMQLTLTRNCSTRQLALWGEGPLSYFLNLQHLAQCLLHIRSQKLFVENDWMNSLLKPFFLSLLQLRPIFWLVFNGSVGQMTYIYPQISIEYPLESGFQTLSDVRIMERVCSNTDCWAPPTEFLIQMILVGLENSHFWQVLRWFQYTLKCPEGAYFGNHCPRFMLWFCVADTVCHSWEHSVID